LNRKYAVLAAVLLIVLVALSLFFTVNLFSKQASSKSFYVGVESAYADQFGEVKALVDKVKDYTNLFIIGSILTFNRSALDQSADYLFNSGLNFIVQFTGLEKYSYNITVWMQDATLKYGERFIGIYRFDEPGGNQLDKGASMLINDTTTYAQTADNYVGNLSSIVTYYFDHGAPHIFTADYGLYWFDYNSSYTAVLGDFVGNESRQRIIALDRGAAQSFNRDWGVIIDWKYDQPPYLESGDELYSDLSLAYSAGAKYAVVFSYPNVTDYGTLTQQHFDALERFWTNIHNDPDSFASIKAEEAYVIPKDYGFGFRNPNDIIWGLYPADALSPKIWNDTNILLAKYYSHLNIIYDEPEVIAPTLKNYTSIFYWNQTAT
jgi:hypothetical protein